MAHAMDHLFTSLGYMKKQEDEYAALVRSQGGPMMAVVQQRAKEMGIIDNAGNWRSPDQKTAYAPSQTLRGMQLGNIGVHISKLQKIKRGNMNMENAPAVVDASMEGGE